MAEWHPLPVARNDDNLSTFFQNFNKEAEKRAKQCEPATVPSLDHLKMADYNVVYEPSDDTYLLLDAIKNEFDSIIRNDNDDNGGSDTTKDHTIHTTPIQTTLEMGCGTGVCTIYLAKLLERQRQHNPSSNTTTTTQHHVTDINPNAIRITMETARENNVTNIEAHQCDLATPLLQTLQSSIDVLLFNPPYVPTPNCEVGGTGIEASWAGGTDGRVVLDRALSQISKLLSRPHGVAYVIVVDDNRPEEIASVMREEYGMLVVPLLRRKARNEFLSVLKMTFV